VRSNLRSFGDPVEGLGTWAVPSPVFRQAEEQEEESAVAYHPSDRAESLPQNIGVRGGSRPTRLLTGDVVASNFPLLRV